MISVKRVRASIDSSIYHAILGGDSPLLPATYIKHLLGANMGMFFFHMRIPSACRKQQTDWMFSLLTSRLFLGHRKHRRPWSLRFFSPYTISNAPKRRQLLVREAPFPVTRLVYLLASSQTCCSLKDKIKPQNVKRNWAVQPLGPKYWPKTQWLNRMQMEECKFFSCETGGKLANERWALPVSGKNVHIH